MQTCNVVSILVKEDQTEPTTLTALEVEIMALEVEITALATHPDEAGPSGT